MAFTHTVTHIGRYQSLDAPPPPEPPPKPFEEPPPISPELSGDTATAGMSGKAMVADAFFDMMRAGVFATDLGFLGWARVLNCLALSPAAPPQPRYCQKHPEEGPPADLAGQRGHPPG